MIPESLSLLHFSRSFCFALQALNRESLLVPRILLGNTKTLHAGVDGRFRCAVFESLERCKFWEYDIRFHVPSIFANIQIYPFSAFCFQLWSLFLFTRFRTFHCVSFT
eukprot:UN09329